MSNVYQCYLSAMQVQILFGTWWLYAHHLYAGIISWNIAATVRSNTKFKNISLQCSYEYCEFCFKKITGKGKFCNFPNCSKGQSLHGHHPRNCMYYLQEMEHTRLQQLLKVLVVVSKWSLHCYLLNSFFF